MKIPVKLNDGGVIELDINISVTDKGLTACPVPDAAETNKGKQILQIQQNITCRLESLKKLMIDLQAEMQFYSPEAASWMRVHCISNMPWAQEKWLLDTRRAVSHLPSKE